MDSPSIQAPTYSNETLVTSSLLLWPQGFIEVQLPGLDIIPLGVPMILNLIPIENILFFKWLNVFQLEIDIRNKFDD